MQDLIADARVRAGAADPGPAFLGFLAGLSQEAAIKRDLSDAIAVPGALRDELHAALDTLLRRAQQAGAVRGDIGTPDLLALVKGLLAAVRDTSDGAPDPALPERLLGVLIHRLRPPG